MFQWCFKSSLKQQKVCHDLSDLTEKKESMKRQHFEWSDKCAKHLKTKQISVLSNLMSCWFSHNQRNNKKHQKNFETSLKHCKCCFYDFQNIISKENFCLGKLGRYFWISLSTARRLIHGNSNESLWKIEIILLLPFIGEMYSLLGKFIWSFAPFTAQKEEGGLRSKNGEVGF